MEVPLEAKKTKKKKPKAPPKEIENVTIETKTDTRNSNKYVRSDFNISGELMGDAEQSKDKILVTQTDETATPLTLAEDSMNEVKNPKFCDTNVLANVNETKLNEFKFEMKKQAIRPYTESQLASFYYNPEMESMDNFTSMFLEAELKGLAMKKHYLYELLTNYLNVSQKLYSNNMDFANLKAEYRDLEDQLWMKHDVMIHGKGVCQDKVTVTLNHKYTKAVFNQSALQSMSRTLDKLVKCITQNHILFSYTVQCLRQQIEIYVYEIVHNIKIYHNITTEWPVILNADQQDAKIASHLSELRLCISILFHFQRKVVQDDEIVSDIQTWINHLVGVLLRVATYQDHLFILHHVLRCPSGVGSWASSLIQVPLPHALENPFTSIEVNHALAILKVILSPIEQRGKFLDGVSQIMKGTQKDFWVVVDSEGEEDEENTGFSLRENDLVSFLNQFPFENLFRLVLSIKDWKSKDSLELSLITEHHVLKFFAFLTTLVKILKTGVDTYQQPKYHQFAKRLSRLIAHMIQYATELLEQFFKSQNLPDTAMLDRLQIEYDAFFLRAIFYLFTAQKLGSWQFLSIVPFHLISESCLWKCFYLMHDIDSNVHELDPFFVQEHMEDTSDQNLNFPEKISNLSEVDGYYLLNTFSNMTIDRKEEEFNRAVCLDLIQVGFISKTTRDNYCKSTRIILGELALLHPYLLSNILNTVSEQITELEDMAIYIFEELPLSLWQINSEDLSTFSRLLMLYDDFDFRGKLARIIISHLNWGYKSDNTLFLPAEIHKEVAILVLKTVDHQPKYYHWGWQTIFRLKLHFSDKGFTDMNLVPYIEKYDIIFKGVQSKKLLHCLVSLLMTSWGHLVPLICSEGLNLILLLQNNVSQQRYDAAMLALYQIVPLFLDCQECLINSTEFQDILTNFLTVDSGYISKAKSLIVEQNVILQQFANMIQAQIANYQFFNLTSPRFLCKIWVNSLISKPNWFKNPSILFLLDVIVKESFLHVDALIVIKNLFKEIIQCSSPLEQSGKITSFFRWMSTSTQDITLISSFLSPFPWLAFVIFEVEFEEKEEKTGLWKEVLLQLNNQKGKSNVDLAVKRAASVTEVNHICSSSSLCIYRWAQQAMDTPLDHPLLPLIWQKFFMLYLFRIPGERPVNGKGCVGEKFFEGIVNCAFFKRMKNRLRDIITFYGKLEVKEMNDVQKGCLKLFHAYELWLEESALHNANVHLPSFPPQYETLLLQILLRGDTGMWWEYFDLQLIKKEEADCVRIWRVNNYRENNRTFVSPKNVDNMQLKEPVDKVHKKFNSYQKPKNPPEVHQYRLPVKIPLDEMSITKLKKISEELKAFAEAHDKSVSTHKSLNAEYIEAVPKLYKSVSNKLRKLVHCKGNQLGACSGSAIIELTFHEDCINQKKHLDIQYNRKIYDKMVESLEKPAASLCFSSVLIQNFVRSLEEQYKLDTGCWTTGTEIFYFILSQLSDLTLKYLPTKSLYGDCLNKLGKTFISGTEFEIPRLLEKILEKPSLYNYLAPHFLPVNVNTANLLLMYTKISTTKLENKILTALLANFDINNWLIQKKPKSSQRSQFIECVTSALEKLGREPSVEAFELHELYRKHLMQMLDFQFPEHYGEILMNLIHKSVFNERLGIAASVWDDLLNTVFHPARINIKSIQGDQLRVYAQTQQRLQYRELLETCELLAAHFTAERLKLGASGLYPKYKQYIKIFAVLLGMIGHTFTASSLNVHQGLMADKLCEKIWPLIRNLFMPWIAPYTMQNNTENNDMAVLLPWNNSDVDSVKIVLEVFVDCISFIMHVLPACNVILNYIWQWYVMTYAHKTIQEYILDLIHGNLMNLPWSHFSPSYGDFEYMIQILDQYLPECHMFLGHIFVQIDWLNWLHNFTHNIPEYKAKIYKNYLNLLVKLSNEPNVRSNYSLRLNTLLIESENLDWTILEPWMFQNIIEWYTMSCDSVVIFKADANDLDFRVFQLLKIVSGYNKIMEVYQTSVVTKRLMFIKGYIKLLFLYSSRHEAVMLQKIDEIAIVIQNQLAHLDRIVSTDDERENILAEFLTVLNIKNVDNVALKCLSQWITSKSGNDATIKILLKIAGKIQVIPEHLANILELAIMNYFQNNVADNYEPTWSELTKYFNAELSNQTQLETVLLNKGCVLTLNAILLQRISNLSDCEVLLNICLQWMENLKINENIEDKVPLIWFKMLRLSLKLSEENEPSTRFILNKFSQILIERSGDDQESGWGWGLLKAVGITKQSTISLGFRFLCRALAGYILAQLPDKKESVMIRKVANAASRVGETGGNSECKQILLKLDFGQTQGKIRENAKFALDQIQNSENSLHNVQEFLLSLTNQFYNKAYLKNPDMQL